MKKSVRIIALLLAMVLMTGCTLFPAKDSTKSYSCRELTMNVPTGLKDVSGQSDYTNYTFALDSNKIAVLGINETFAEYSFLEEYNTKEYADLIIQLYGVNGTASKRSGKDYHYIIYSSTTDLGACTCVAGVFKNSEGFWLIQVIALDTEYDEQTSLSYLDSVKFN